ncbi:hypothetical protein AYO45_01910 [Gammaproteobacteria bacterium SCGC AG-212-F23]|nr:hypothetical protein AYO45_01910 [Gammaproteobacteria bacterium SCGC AG-212-F23]
MTNEVINVAHISSLTIDKSELQILAKNLRMLLNAKGVSEYEIAQSLGIPFMTVRRIVSGETGDPRISTLKLIASYFNVSIDSLLEENDSKSPDFLTKRMPQFIPILDWDIVANTKSIEDIDLSEWNDWHPIIPEENLSLSKSAFALASRHSMQPRFPMGTLFIIDPNEAPADGDIVLIKMKSDGELSLRELIIDSPKWQLQPVVSGSEVLYYEENQHQIIGIIILTILHTRKDK